MQPTEASWLGEQLAGFPKDRISPLLNVGSGSAHFRQAQHPWIEEHIFAPLDQRAIKVSHLDIFPAPGIDIVGDPCEVGTKRGLAQVEFHSAICANVLEHVPDRERLANALLNVLSIGGLLFVTVPHAYPYHACPIDTLFRPDIEELHALFPGTRLLAGEIIDCGSFFDQIRHQPLLIPRLLLPVYKPKRWYGLIQRIPWLTRTYQETCIVLQKQTTRSAN